ncbi:hypothetical protein HX112_08985 [Acinetobacter towneri]|uniref:hypothetical protein n=1 Tax=Acinetobacter towneri TaxID=202956 RepID=UPI0025771E9E|nr:hypothetical protein [Acinetobacter towneri]MDM1736679.1 hypothetical protein [Acinetobacter towneri]
MPNLAHTSEQSQGQKPKFIETELGKEKLCIQCQEYWPLDAEFWFTYKGKPKKDGTKTLCYEAACKCCYSTRYKPHRQQSAKNVIRSNYERGLGL